MVTFYHRFLPAAASIMEPLYELLSSKSKELSWNEAASIAFESVKEALANATMCQLGSRFPGLNWICGADWMTVPDSTPLAFMMIILAVLLANL
ncbi:hypothetical protein Pcinc_016606 [Petrolisthes cinctipes]|uniref:Reverse transcriptase/retrotransposon-derived protein RNase H-like domain-containing protein n=1 Tax=Petrolisthes cinctipes TaxID=88211 RepID=A0AAE1FSI5_PETCI|nr:hypothetical protein Pcinc_016606 [Petrolisthes cinctipes]